VGDVVTAVTTVPGLSPSQPGAIFAATGQALQQAGRLDTYVGQLALVIATQMDRYSVLEPGGGLVALSRELDRLLGIALASVNIEPDELDELTERRRRKAARAGT
jgi:hypothetical protein